MRIGRHDTTQDGAYIIAEAGVNHNGSLTIAKKLVDEAAAAKANAVKFQMYQTSLLVSATARKQYDMLERYVLSREQFLELKQYCDQKGITFLATPFDAESAAALDQMGVDAFKIGSGDLTCHALLRQVSGYNKPVLLSTGMSGLGEIEAALDCLPGETAILHCTSAYPAPVESVHLRALDTLQSAFGRPVGYSDHTKGIEIPIAAVARGCQIVEKHFTLDRGMEGPDHQASLEPDELKQMVESIRHVEAALGSTLKTVAEAERNTKKKVRRGVYAARNLAAGHMITEDDLVYLRPVASIAASDYVHVVGRRLRTSKPRYEPIRWHELD